MTPGSVIGPLNVKDVRLSDDCARAGAASAAVMTAIAETIRNARAETTRKAVQVSSADGTKAYDIFFTLPAQTPEAASIPEVRFIETAADMPAAVRTWRYPGERIGYEFIYPMGLRDKLFALAFKDEVRAALPPAAPFTGDAATLRNAISDGRDNASTTPLEEVVTKTQASNTVVFTIGLIDPVEPDSNPKRLKQIAEPSGGEAFTPRNASQVAGVLHRISHDIRHSYTIRLRPDRALEKARLPSDSRDGQSARWATTRRGARVVFNLCRAAVDRPA